jgi:hypothetical protein
MNGNPVHPCGKPSLPLKATEALVNCHESLLERILSVSARAQQVPAQREDSAALLLE